jgi:hypothetical protein
MDGSVYSSTNNVILSLDRLHDVVGCVVALSDTQFLLIHYSPSENMGQLSQQIIQRREDIQDSA